MGDNKMEFTHELIMDDTRYFNDDIKILDKLVNIFEDIYDIQLINTSQLSTIVKVRGKIHLYGFKVLDGGFFDIFNYVYYDEKIIKNKNALIFSTNKNNLMKIIN